MSAYFLFDNLEVTDASKLDEYKTLAAPTVQRHGGRYVVLGDQVDLLEGSWKPTFPVMSEFSTLEQAHRWYGSPEYRALKQLRQSAGRFNGVVIEGIAT